MARVLIVTNPFGDRRVGQRITDPTEMAEVLAGENAQSVVMAEHPDVVAPTAKPSKPEE